MRKRKRKKNQKKILITLSIIFLFIMTAGYAAFQTNLNIKVKGNIKFPEWNFDYTGEEQTLTAPYTGKYKIEIWGAQGGNANKEPDTTKIVQGGYGGYSIGTVFLNQNNKLYINVGGVGIWKHASGEYCENLSGGYNGGGIARICYIFHSYSVGSGGGATSISTTSGLLSSLKDNQDSIIVVAGGGGGALSYYDEATTSNRTVDYLGSGGGYIGVTPLHTDYGEKYADFVMPTGGTQTSSGTSSQNATFVGSFGTGRTTEFTENRTYSGGGGGYYGGVSAQWEGASGGSGYIGNTNLTDKHMACYNCETSDEESTKTISVTCALETPTEDCAKIGNGHARITYLGNS